MERSPSLDPRRQWLVWFTLLATTAVALGIRIGHEPLWLDETYSLAMSRHGFVDILRLVRGDVHPPLYYLVLKAATLLFGSSPVALRLPSLLATLGLLALGAGPVRRLWGERTAYLYALFVATSPGILCFAQEARMYALATCFVTAAVLHGQLVLREARTRDLIYLGAFTWAAAMTHYFALVAVGVNGLVLLVVTTTQHPRQARPILATLAVATALYVPWLPSFVRQVSTVAHGFWIPPTSWKLVVYGLVAPFTYKFEDVPYPWQALAAATLVAFVVGASLFLGMRRGTRSRTQGLATLVLVYGLTLAFGIAFSRLIQPIFMPRYMMCCAGLLLLATAIGVSQIPRLPQLAVAAAVFTGLGLPAWLRIQRETFDGPFAMLAEQVHAAGDPKPLLLHNDCQAIFPSLHVLPQAQHVMVTPKDAPFDVSSGGVYDTRQLASTSDPRSLLETTNRVWVVDEEPTGFHIAPAQILEQPGWQQVGNARLLALPMSWVKLKLTRYERR